jgi:DNA-binding Xre family transcriptional regulator
MFIMLDVIKVTIKDQADKKKVSMYRVAKDTGVAYSTLWKLNTGKVNSIDFDVLSKLCEYFNCSTSDIISFQK